MKKGFGISIALIILLLGTNFISALTPSLCKDSNGYYQDCGIVHGYSSGISSNIGYYSDYGSYDYGKLTYCRNSRGEYYYCYKQYNDYTYDDNDYYDDYHYYYDRNYYQQYNDRYGNVIKISRPNYNRQYCYWTRDGSWWSSRKVCRDVYDYQDDPYYPDYYVQLNLKNEETKPVNIYIN